MGASSRKLVEEASKGDSLALEELLQHHLPGVLAYVRLHGGAVLVRESSEDIVQSACREVLADLASLRYRNEAMFKHWLYTAAERKILDRARYWRREKRDFVREVPLGNELSDSQATSVLDRYASFCTPSQQAVAREELERIEQTMAALPEDYRDVIVLSRMIGLTHAEIAEQLGRSEGAVRMLLHRALARLARSLGGQTPSA